MDITVFGGTGQLGRLIIEQALVAGHRVTAVVREPGRLAIRSDGLDEIVADVLDGDSLVPAVKGRDAVLSAIGSRPGGPTTVREAATTAIIGAMRRAGTRRLVVVSSSGAYVDAGDDRLSRYLIKPILQRVLRDDFADVRAAERVVRASDVDWTTLRPSQLTNKPANGRIRRRYDGNLPSARACSRADVAVEMLRAMADTGTIGHSVAVAN